MGGVSTTQPAAPSAQHGERENMVKNGGFEEDADGNGMADHWQFAGDKEVTVTWGHLAGSLSIARSVQPRKVELGGE